MSQNQHKTTHKIRQFLDIIILLILVPAHVFSPEPMLKAILGLVFSFLPGYSVTRFVLHNRKEDYTATITYTVIVSLCVLPLIGNFVQLVTFISSYTLLAAVLVFSLPFLFVCDRNLIEKEEEKRELEDEKNAFYKGMAFFGSIAVGLGLYVQASLGAVAPRGYDIYAHTYLVNNMISTGKLVFHPDLNVLSNFHHFLFAELSLLTGFDLLTTAIVAQTMMGAVFAISMFYFTKRVTGSLTASLISTVLFFAAPPIFNADLTRYFWFFHPMWVALSIFPFALAYVHETLISNKNRSIGLAPILILALFLYSLPIGLIFIGIIILDFLLLLLKLRKKFLFLNLAEIVVLTSCLSLPLTVPFLLNITNPFKSVYPQGGLQALYGMFFGYSTRLFILPSKGWAFFAEVVSRFVKEMLPLIVIGVPGLVYLFRKRSTSFILVFSCILTGLIGLLQPWLGLAFLPQRFSGPLIMFGSTLAGASLSLLMVIPNIRFRKHGRSMKISVNISKQNSSSFTLLLLTFSFILLYSYVVFYSPAKEAVLAADLEIHEDDLAVIKWIDENLPRNSRILTDHYFQPYFTGITGRKPLFSITTERQFYQIWDVYPVNVYIGGTDPLKVDVDYIVVSPWCYTTWSFVGKEYFDQHEGLVNIHEFFLPSWHHSTLHPPYYAVYEVLK